ncbi:MAG: 4-hydroxybenzoate octaprenyltransferase [Geminicoccaceae bacterium]|nr:4-hydroxybenzoate octaprenyltransferase [Geminicoccaceae bacterium]MCB9943288.1 4-hydroxybenzoate octaprenyltransferase [Geminicoccaceae bacterium]
MHQRSYHKIENVADQQIPFLGWLPAAWRDYATLARLDRPIGTWLLLIPCWWGMALVEGGLDPVTGLLFAIGAIAMRGAGCTVNDLADRKFDARVERTRNRPLAAGRVSIPAAVLFTAFQSLIGLSVLFWLPRTAQLIAIGSLPLIVIYPFMKRITYWPQAFLGLTFNWGALVGYAAMADQLDWSAVVLYAGGIAWTLGYDTIYAHQDKEDDILVGVRSSALRLGSATVPWICGFYTIAIVLIAVAGTMAGLSWPLYPALLVPAAHMVWQVRSLSIDDRDNCLMIFRANRLAGLLVLAALALGHL